MIWEYTFTEDTSHVASVAHANEMGKDGWELVHIQYILDVSVVVGFFKRLKS